jgi:two-component system KDP operon response regulator KdpE
VLPPLAARLWLGWGERDGACALPGRLPCPPATRQLIPVLPHLLLVDDSALVTEALGVLFEETGHRVTVASSVAGALAACAADRPDVMLLDVTLGDEDGLAVLDALRRAGGPLPATVAVTGHDDRATRDRCLDAGCIAVLLKPVPTRELLRVIGALLPA